MISVEMAIKLIQNHRRTWDMEVIPLESALNRVLTKPIFADRDFPPFTRVSMDGIAIAFQSFQNGQREFRIAGVQPAGSPPIILEDPKQCIEVMTGAMIPVGTDTVIRYEDLQIEEGIARIEIEDVRHRQNAHGQGIDRQAGEKIIPAGIRISPAEIGLAATVGQSELEVYRIPNITVITTGDELVSVSTIPEAYQIRQSNAYTIQATLEKSGFPANRQHLPDDKSFMLKEIRQLLSVSDILILTGGVSKGKFDYLPEVFAELGVKKLFHKVEQRPGKPFWFGIGKESQLVFALPGNPVSSFMCTCRYVIPFLEDCFGLAGKVRKHAILTEDVIFKPNLTYFVQVKLDASSDGTLHASPMQGKGSGDLANLADVDGFLELPAGQNHYTSGTAYPLFLFR